MRSDVDQPTLSHKQLYLRGVIMNVSNPNVAIFFLAFLPQFSDLNNGPVAQQILLLGAIFIAAAALVFGAIACGTASLGDWFKGSTRAQCLLVWQFN